jgi:hypothetical protein
MNSPTSLWVIAAPVTEKRLRNREERRERRAILRALGPPGNLSTSDAVRLTSAVTIQNLLGPEGGADQDAEEVYTFEYGFLASKAFTACTNSSMPCSRLIVVLYPYDFIF